MFMRSVPRRSRFHQSHDEGCLLTIFTPVAHHRYLMMVLTVVCALLASFVFWGGFLRISALRFSRCSSNVLMVVVTCRIVYTNPTASGLMFIILPYIPHWFATT